jgi:hypothetical protein
MNAATLVVGSFYSSSGAEFSLAPPRPGVLPTSQTSVIESVLVTPTAFQAIDMGGFITADFNAIDTVESVRVRRKHDDFIVEVKVSSFDERTRRAVYAKQKALHREFPNLDFEFHVIDAEERKRWRTC